MKAQIMQFYQDQVQARIEALKAKITGVKQQVTAWWSRRRRSILGITLTVAGLVLVAVLAYLWQRSPTFRASVKGLAVAAAGLLAGLWMFLKGCALSLSKGNRSAGIPAPVIVTEQPYQEVMVEEPPFHPMTDGHLS